MYGKNDNQWHEEGQPVKEYRIVGYDVYKTGEKKGKKKPIREWVLKTQKRKVIIGYDGIYTRGKNKGEPKPIYETKELPIPSTGFFPSVNHIYMSANFRGGGGRRLKQIAEDHLNKWKEIAIEWKEENGWETKKASTKVVVNLFFYLPKGKKDTHNAKKLLLDALEGVIHEDDYFILDRTIDFEIDEVEPRIELEILLPEEADQLNNMSVLSK
jgi:Holliday junction resolvase RusA-like endonuclease